MSLFFHYKKLMYLLIITLLAILAFGQTYHNEFLGMDDHVYVWDNPHIKDGLTIDGITWAFKADLTEPSEFADYWQPVTFISRMVDISLFKLDAGWHHLGNLLFHIFNIWLLYYVLLRMTGSSLLSLCVAGLWAIHPLHAEIIGWTTARKDVLSVFFGLLTMCSYFSLRHKHIVLRQIMTAVLFVLSLMAKPMMITIPCLLVFFDCYKQLSQNKKLTFKTFYQSILDKWLLFLIICIYLPIPFLGQPEAFDNVNPAFMKAFTAYIFYLQKIFVPVKLSLYGPIPEVKISWVYFVFSVICVLSVSVVAWMARRRNFLILFGWAWFLLTSLPIIALTWPADRFVYFPMIGVLLMSAAFLKDYIKKKDYVCSIGIVFAIFFLIQSFRQIQVWKNDETVMLRALMFSPKNYSAHNVLGVYYARHKDEEKALLHLKKAIRIRPERDKPYNNIGLILERQGKMNEALKYFQKSVGRKTDDFRTLNNIGIVYVRQGKYHQGIEYFKKALDINPLAQDIRNNIAIAHFKAGNIQNAEAMADQWNSAYLFHQFGLFLAIDKQYQNALHYFNKALSIEPNFPKTQNYIDQIQIHLNN